MRLWPYLLLLSGTVWAEAVFVSPVANFKDRTITLNFLPDINKVVTVRECLIVRNKEKRFTLLLNQRLAPQKDALNIERKISFPETLRTLSDLDGTEVQCTPGQFRVSTWRLEGINE